MLGAPVAVVVYALFENPEAAAEAEADVLREHPGRGPRLVQRHTQQIDGNILPDRATEYGRNLLLAMGLGAVFMAAAGGIAGALDVMLGMGVGLGIGLGFITGLLMGLVGAMQAGTRIAKPPLRALEPRLRGGHVLLVVEAEPSESKAMLATLDRHGPVELDVLGGW